MKQFKQKVQEEGLFSVATVVQGNIKFALDLYQKLRTAEDNLFFSPYSISTALAMTFAGARGTLRHKWLKLFISHWARINFILHLRLWRQN